MGTLQETWTMYFLILETLSRGSLVVVGVVQDVDDDVDDDRHFRTGPGSRYN